MQELEREEEMLLLLTSSATDFKISERSGGIADSHSLEEGCCGAHSSGAKLL